MDEAGQNSYRNASSGKSNQAVMDFSLAVNKHVEVVGTEVDLTPTEERKEILQQSDQVHKEYSGLQDMTPQQESIERNRTLQQWDSDFNGWSRPPSIDSVNSIWSNNSLKGAGGNRFTVKPVAEVSQSVGSLYDSDSPGSFESYRIRNSELPYANASISSFSDSLSSFYNGEDELEDCKTCDIRQGTHAHNSSIPSLDHYQSSQPPLDQISQHIIYQNMPSANITRSRFATVASNTKLENSTHGETEGIYKTITFAEKCTYHTFEYYTADKEGNSAVTSPSQGDYSDDSSYYDTVSSTSSTATLLRKVVAHNVDVNPDAIRQEPDGCSDDGYSIQYGRPGLPNVCVHRVASHHVEQEVTGLMQGAGTGQALLAESLDQVRKSFDDLSPVFISNQVTPTSNKKHEQEKQAAELSSTYIRNLIVLSIGFMLAYTAFFSLRNLQSSINHERGLGLIGLSTVYASFLLGCIFAPSIVNCMRPKSAIVMAMHGNLASVLANFYPTFYTLIPASAILGFTMAILWTAQGTYITSLAMTYAALTNKSHDAILGVFIGFFLFLVQIAQILGNLISSSVFTMEMSGPRQLDKPTSHVLVHVDQNTSIFNDSAVKSLPLLAPKNDSYELLPTLPNKCGASYCHSYNIDHDAEGSQLNQHTLYILLGIFTGLTVLSILVLAVFLNKLDVIFRKSSCRIGKQLLAIFSLHRDRRLLAFLPLMIYVGIEEAFIFGEITKVSQKDISRSLEGTLC